VAAPFTTPCAASRRDGQSSLSVEVLVDGLPTLPPPLPHGAAAAPVRPAAG